MRMLVVTSSYIKVNTNEECCETGQKIDKVNEDEPSKFTTGATNE